MIFNILIIFNFFFKTNLVNHNIFVATPGLFYDTTKVRVITCSYIHIYIFLFFFIYENIYTKKKIKIKIKSFTSIILKNFKTVLIKILLINYFL